MLCTLPPRFWAILLYALELGTLLGRELSACPLGGTALVMSRLLLQRRRYVALQ
jgi:hypothetical protein